MGNPEFRKCAVYGRQEKRSDIEAQCSGVCLSAPSRFLDDISRAPWSTLRSVAAYASQEARMFCILTRREGLGEALIGIEATKD